MAEEKPQKRKARRRPAFQMRISTRYAPRKVAEGQARSCITGSALNEAQLLELFRYLKLTRLVEERIVNLYRQTKVVQPRSARLTRCGRTISSRRSFATSALALSKGFAHAKSLPSTWRKPGDLPGGKISTFISVI
jgi:hypothetical protein